MGHTDEATVETQSLGLIERGLIKLGESSDFLHGCDDGPAPTPGKNACLPDFGDTGAMARRRKSSPADDLFELVAMLPSWGGIALAVI